MPYHTKQNAPVGLARRHFLSVAAAATQRVIVTGALGMAAISSSAEAQGNKGGNGNNNGWSKGGGGGGGGGKGGGLCFLAGTRIATVQGEACIEDLRIGDLVETADGEALPIKWIGRQSFKKSGSTWPESVMPIRVSRFALDEQTPHTDLYLSPWHCLLIDGFLMPVKELVNGVSIVPAMPASREIIEYFQILLDRHAVLLAEGAPADSLLIRTGEELEMFTNFVEYERLYGSERPLMQPFAPLCYHAGGRAHLKALMRLGLSKMSNALGAPQFSDMRDPSQIAYERIAERARLAVGSGA